MLGWFRRRASTGASPAKMSWPSLVGAGLSLCVGLPSALVSVQQARTAAEDASRAERALNAAETQAKAAEGQFEAALKLSVSAARTAEAIERIASDASITNSQLEKGNATARGNLKAQMDQAAAMERQVASSSRARLRLSGWTILDLRPNQKAKIEMKLENIGANSARLVKMSQQIYIHKIGDPTEPYIQCNQIKNPQAWNIGNYRFIKIERNLPTREEEIQLIKSGKAVLAVQGLICYDDGNAVSRVLAFCQYYTPQTSNFSSCKSGEDEN